ncbi:MAG: S1C family serine protease [Acidimicrobiales bacterium]
MLKIDRSGLPVAVIGRPTSKLQLGDPVIAIDSAQNGAGTPSIPVGVINSLGERIESEDADKALYNMIQTNLRLTSAATGAPLIDTSGAVIGIITSRGFKAPKPAGALTASTGTEAPRNGRADQPAPPARYATPVDYARAVADSLIKDKKFPHVWLGVEGRSLTPDQATKLDVTGGVLVQTVSEHSPAEQAGVAVGDVIIQVEQTPVTSWDDLVVELRRHRPGDSVTVWYVRNGERDPAFPTLLERTTAGK